MISNFSSPQKVHHFRLHRLQIQHNRAGRRRVHVHPLLERGLRLPSAGVDPEHAPVLGDPADVDVPGMEDFRDRVDHEPVLAVRRDRRPLPVRGREVAAHEHRLHHRPRLLVRCSRDLADHIVDRAAVVHEDLHLLEADKGGVLDEDAVLREFFRELLRYDRLRLGTPDNVVVSRREDDPDSGRDEREELPEPVVLLVDIPDRQLVLLPGEYPDAVHEIAGNEEERDVRLLEPPGETGPAVLEKRRAPDMDVGDEDRLPGVGAPVRRVADRHVGPEELVGKEDAAVCRERSPDRHNLVREERLGIGKPGPPLVEEDRDAPGRVLDLRDPVAVRRGPEIAYHADDRAGLLPVPRRPQERLDGKRAHPPAEYVPEARVPVAEVVDVIGDTSDTPCSSGGPRDDLDLPLLAEPNPVALPRDAGYVPDRDDHRVLRDTRDNPVEEARVVLLGDVPDHVRVDLELGLEEALDDRRGVEHRTIVRSSVNMELVKGHLPGPGRVIPCYIMGRL